MPAPEEVIARVFTSANPTSGSPPLAAIAWVVFAHGTTFFTVPTDQLPLGASLAAIAEAARAALRELGPAAPGSPSADFNTSRLDNWFPEEPVWFVGFDHPDLATVITTDAPEVSAGLQARACRDLDHDELSIVVVRGFDGAIDRPAT